MLIAAAPAEAGFPGANGKIAFHSNRDGNFEIYVMNSDGTSPTRLTNNAAEDLSPAWSADGTKIAFTSARDGNYEIYVMNANGTGQTRLTNDGASDVTAAWSPDGTKIVWATNRDGNFEVYTMNANGTSPTRLTNETRPGPRMPFDGQPAWSPNGDKIAYVNDSDFANDFDIWTMNPDGTGKVPVTARFGPPDTEPDWSPDADLLAFQTVWESATTDTDVYTDPVGSGCCTAIAADTWNEKEPAWSPDGTRIAIANDRFGDYEIQVLRSDGSGSLQTLTNNSAADQAPDWQPVVNNYARPAGATPTRLALVPAYRQCTVTNTKHKGALPTRSCVPPTAESTALTVGTPDFNSQPASAVGFVKLSVFCNGGAPNEPVPCLTTPGDQLDGQIVVSQTDVRCTAGTSGCPGGALSDYQGSLWMELTARITDKNSGGSTGAATLEDIPVRFFIPCATTSSTSVGSTCETTTSFDAVLGGASVITEQKRAVWQLSDVNVWDGGGGSTQQFIGRVFLVGGLFFP